MVAAACGTPDSGGDATAADASSTADASGAETTDDGSSTSTSGIGSTETTSATGTSRGRLECEEGPEACDEDEPCGDRVCTDDEVCVVPGDACVCDDAAEVCEWVAVEPACVTFPQSCVGVGLVEPCLVEDLCPSEDDFGGGGSFDEGVLTCLPAVAECQGDCDVRECGGSSGTG